MAGVLGVTGWIGFVFFFALELLVSSLQGPSLKAVLRDT